jgi:hypothetical protein
MAKGAVRGSSSTKLCGSDFTTVGSSSTKPFHHLRCGRQSISTITSCFEKRRSPASSNPPAWRRF